jgi:tetratricopeptide (TPR) repeat protein
MGRFKLVFLLFAIPMLASDAFGQKNSVVDSLIQHTTQQNVDSLRLDIKRQVDNTKQSESYIQLGLCEENLNHFDSALDAYSMAVALDTGAKMAYFKRGVLYERKGKLDAAIKDDSKAISLYSNDTTKLTFLYARVGFMQWLLKRNIEALHADSMAVRLDSNNKFAYANMGFTHFAVKKYEKAIQDFTAAMRGYGDDKGKLTTIVGARGNAKRRLGRYIDAIEDYNLALELSPSDKPSSWNRALSYELIGDYDRSYSEYTKTMSLFVGDNLNLSKLYDERALLEIDEHRYKEALADDSIAISLNNKLSSAYLNRALEYSLKGDPELSIDAYKIALKYYENVNPVTCDIYTSIGNEDYILGQYDQAIEAYTTAITMNTYSVAAYLGRGKAYLKKGNSTHSKLDFNNALLADTTKMSSDYAFVLYYTGKPLEAVEMMKCVISKTNTQALLSRNYYNMACLYSLMNKPKDANAYLRKCVEMGYPKEFAMADPDLENIRNTQDFKKTIIFK